MDVALLKGVDGMPTIVEARRTFPTAALNERVERCLSVRDTLSTGNNRLGGVTGRLR